MCNQSELHGGLPGAVVTMKGLSLSLLCCLRGYLGKAELHLDREGTKGTQGLCPVQQYESVGHHPASGEEEGVKPDFCVEEKKMFSQLTAVCKQ